MSIKRWTPVALSGGGQNRMTLPVVLQSFIGRGDIDWASVMASSMIYTLPVVILFLLLRRHLMTARLAGGVKG